MFISITKIFALTLGLIVIIKTYLDYRKKEETFQMFLLWTLLWITIIILAFSPWLISKTILLIGERKVSIGKIVGMGFIFIFFVIYRVYVKAHRLEKNMNKLIRKIALINLKKNHKK